jgi:hypothetical protein
LNGFLFDGGRFELVVTVQQEVRQTPMAICTSRKSTPESSMVVTNVCRSMCGCALAIWMLAVSAVWTRHQRSPALTPRLRAWFADSGFAEIAFDALDTGGSWDVATPGDQGGDGQEGGGVQAEGEEGERGGDLGAWEVRAVEGQVGIAL